MNKIPETDLGGIDHGVLEHRQREHGTIVEQVETIKAGEKAARVISAPIDRYRRDGTLTERQWQAGDDLRKDYHTATHRPGNSGYDGTPGTTRPGPSSVNDIMLDADRKYRAAMAAVGFYAAQILHCAVIHELTLDELARATRYSSAKKARGALELSLDQLASHYGIR